MPQTNASDSYNPLHQSAEADKFQLFEQWLLDNGAAFPMLELRKYDNDDRGEEGNGNGSSNTNESGENIGVNVEEEDNEAEEKKDGGVREGTSLANMSLDGSSSSHDNNSTQQQQQQQLDDGSKEMRGVHAKTSIPPNTICVSIPKSCLITVEMGQATPIGRKILTSDLELDAPKHIFLMIYILWDRKVNGETSFFAPYYKILPETLRNMPIFWTREELDALEGSYLLLQIADRAEAIKEDYISICSIAPEFGDIATLEEFQWARMIVCSRNFGLLINGHRTSALVPHADMLNHLRPRETKWTFSEESQSFTITTLQEIGMGEQVFDSYGQKCNHRFLLNYGFCVERNVEVDGFCPNEVPLELGLDCLGWRGEEEGEQQGGGGDRFSSLFRGEDLECWEKKLAFWTRGEVGHGFFSGGGESGGGAGSLGASFQALAAAMAGSSSARGGISATSNSIVEAMTAMNDATSVAQLTRAVTGGASSSASRPTIRSPICPIKRVRVCVSNNENTRALFSMLRVLACNSAELDRISWGGRMTNGPTSSPFYAGGGAGGSSSTAQRLFGIPPGEVPLSSSHSLRTCRDIRYPINLNNERRAMELLLEIIGRALSKYPTSLAQDTADLLDEKSFPKYSNKRHAKLQVHGEKEVLHHFALWARTAIRVIDIILHEISLGRNATSSIPTGGVSSSASAGILCNSSGIEAVSQNEELGYEHVIQAMEDDDDCHATILRYCSDVLGAVRRDELSRIGTEALNVSGSR